MALNSPPPQHPWVDAMKTVTVVSVERHDDGFPPEGLRHFIAWMNEKIAKIPKQHLDSATIEIDSTGGYEGEHYAEITISYKRPYTEAEETRMAQEEANQNKAQQDRDRAEYERLKRIYGEQERPSGGG